MSIGSISTYRNRKRACCQSSDSKLYFVHHFYTKMAWCVDISGALLKQLYSLHQRLILKPD